MLDAGLARVMVPVEAGGYGLGFETFFELTRILAWADASHGWCAGQMIHHNHLIGHYPEAGRAAVWAGGPDVAVAASLVPAIQAVAAEGGYRISGKGSPFISGIDHCTWVMLSGRIETAGQADWGFFLVPPGEYTVRDTWFTAAMRATGSKTVVIDDAFVPGERVLMMSALRDGRTPGGAVFPGAVWRAPYSYYAPIAVVAPLLGAAQGAYERLRAWLRTRPPRPSVPVTLARAAADLDAAELLCRHAVAAAGRPAEHSPRHLTRSLRDFARIAELTVSVADTLQALSGTAGFDSAHPSQRAWRDIHFMATHAAVNAEKNYGHFGTMELAAGQPG
jgi:alkylation response protein AidB-like acyl-CoA dehydrogenase